MATFTVGEEVLFQGERYVIAGVDPTRPYPYRLLAVAPSGTRFVWASHESLAKIDAYTKFPPPGAPPRPGHT